MNDIDFREEYEEEKRLKTLSKCPNCGSKTLKALKDQTADFECTNKWCRRFDKFDYIKSAMLNYIQVNRDEIFKICFKGVNFKP